MIWIFTEGLFFIACSIFTNEKDNEDTGTFGEVTDTGVEHIDSGEDFDTGEEDDSGEDTDTSQESDTCVLPETMNTCEPNVLGLLTDDDGDDNQMVQRTGKNSTLSTSRRPLLHAW